MKLHPVSPRNGTLYTKSRDLPSLCVGFIFIPIYPAPQHARKFGLEYPLNFCVTQEIWCQTQTVTLSVTVTPHTAYHTIHTIGSCLDFRHRIRYLLCMEGCFWYLISTPPTPPGEVHVVTCRHRKLNTFRLSPQPRGRAT